MRFGRATALGLAVLLAGLSLGAAGTRDRTQGQKVLGKLGRAVVNVATGWMELPREVYFTTKDKHLGAGLTLGLMTGVGVAAVRTVAGAFELVTFPFAVPNDYEPILEPEFVVDASRTDVGQFSTKRRAP